MQLYSTLSFIQNISLFLLDQIWIAWNQLRSGGKGQRTGSKRNKWWPGGGRGQGGNAAEPRDMPLMRPFCDISLVSNVFMLTDLRCCGQYRGLSISCTYNSGKDFKIWTRVDWRHQGISPGSTLSPSQTTSQLALLHYSKDPAIMNNFFGIMALCYSRGFIKILQTSYGWWEKKN